jgi:hypothetical protein
MSRQGTAAFTMVAVAATLAASAAPASARPKGHESFDGTIVVAGVSGARKVVHSVVVGRGVFDGVGRIVEVANRPGDPDAVSRDDLVFGRGTMHIVNTNHSVKLVSMNPQTCEFNIHIQQTTKIAGGTGGFSHASGSFAGTVRARGVGARNADGSCSQEQAALLEADILTSKGTLSV